MVSILGGFEMKKKTPVSSAEAGIISSQFCLCSQHSHCSTHTLSAGRKTQNSQHVQRYFNIISPAPEPTHPTASTLVPDGIKGPFLWALPLWQNILEEHSLLNRQSHIHEDKPIPEREWRYRMCVFDPCKRTAAALMVFIWGRNAPLKTVFWHNRYYVQQQGWCFCHGNSSGKLHCELILSTVLAYSL